MAEKKDRGFVGGLKGFLFGMDEEPMTRRTSSNPPKAEEAKPEKKPAPHSTTDVPPLPEEEARPASASRPAPKKEPETSPTAETPKGNKPKEESTMSNREREAVEGLRPTRIAAPSRDPNPEDPFGFGSSAPRRDAPTDPSPARPAVDPVMASLRQRMDAYKRIQNARPVAKVWFLGKIPYDAERYAQITGLEPREEDAQYVFLRTDKEGRHTATEMATADDFLLYECQQAGFGGVV